MREYENLIIFDPESGEENISKKTDKLKEIIEKKGKVSNINKWGMRQLAYPINKKEQGYYVLLEFTAEKELLPELDHELKLSKDIMRHCIVRK
ncbi:30S ribosomal protein S6 [candidate division WOR-3 bacterium]|nr:30S ribosomal protein S6 [candidate division WOR-3 bacterium]